MRKISYSVSVFALLAILLTFNYKEVQSQICVNTIQGGQVGCNRSGTTSTTEILPTGGASPVSSLNYSPGTYFRMPVLAGGCYTIGTCGAPFDTQINCYQGTNTTAPFAYNDDAGPLCGTTAASCSMVPNFTDYARIDVRQYSCLPGGSSSITVTVQQNNNLAITSSTAAMCQGQTRTLSAVPAPVTGQQPNSGQPGVFTGSGVSGNTFTAPIPGGAGASYIITYTFGYCSTTQAISVFHAPTTANAGPDQTVCTSSVTLGGNSPSFGSGSWVITNGTGTITSPTSATTSVTGLLPSSSVTLRWTISNGVCTPSMDSVVITRDAAPTSPSAGIDANVCQDSIVLNANSPSTGSGSWSVITGGGSLSSSTNPNALLSNLSLGANTVVWSISNGVCQALRDSVTIFRDAQPSQPYAGPDKTICEGNTSLTGNIPGVGSGNWSLFSGSGIITTPTAPNSGVTGINIGTSAFRWVISNGTCPAKSDTIVVTRVALPASPTISGSQTVCYGSPAILNASTSVSNPTIIWWDALTGGNVLASGPTYTTPPLTNNVDVFVEVVDGNVNCSSQRTQYSISVLQLPAVSLGPDQSFCSDDSLCLDAGPGLAGYQWNTGETSRIICTNVSGTYWVEVTDGNGCHNTDTVSVYANTPPTVSLGPDFTICNGGLHTLSVPQVAGQNYLWTNGATANSITISAAGTYAITVTDFLTGCSTIDEVVGTESATPVAGFAMNTTGCPNIVFTDQSTNADTWVWSFGNGATSNSASTSYSYQGTGNGNYTVTLIASGPCGSDTMQQVLNINCVVGVVMPDNLAITVYPNPNDGIFKIHFEGLESSCELMIFNELGQQVYAKDIQECGGTCDEVVDISQVASGVYFAHMKIGDMSIAKRVVVR